MTGQVGQPPECESRFAVILQRLSYRMRGWVVNVGTGVDTYVVKVTPRKTQTEGSTSLPQLLMKSFVSRIGSRVRACLLYQKTCCRSLRKNRPVYQNCIKFFVVGCYRWRGAEREIP